MSVAEVFGQGLTNKVSVYVPHTVDIRKTLTDEVAEQYAERTLRFFSHLFGGATALTAEGGYIAIDGTLVVEKITIVYAFASSLTSGDLDKLFQYCSHLKAELGQEQLSVEINGELFFL